MKFFCISGYFCISKRYQILNSRHFAWENFSDSARVKLHDRSADNYAKGNISRFCQFREICQNFSVTNLTTYTVKEKKQPYSVRAKIKLNKLLMLKSTKYGNICLCLYLLICWKSQKSVKMWQLMKNVERISKQYQVWL